MQIIMTWHGLWDNPYTVGYSPVHCLHLCTAAQSNPSQWDLESRTPAHISHYRLPFSATHNITHSVLQSSPDWCQKLSNKALTMHYVSKHEVVHEYQNYIRNCRKLCTRLYVRYTFSNTQLRGNIYILNRAVHDAAPYFAPQCTLLLIKPLSTNCL